MEETLNLIYTEKDGIMYPQIQISINKEADENPLGKYGLMALNYLKDNNPNRYSLLLSEGELLPVMHRLNKEAYERLGTIIEQMLKTDPVLKPEDTMESYKHRLLIHNTAEEIVLYEMIFIPR